MVSGVVHAKLWEVRFFWSLWKLRQNIFFWKGDWYNEAGLEDGDIAHL